MPSSTHEREGQDEGAEGESGGGEIGSCKPQCSGGGGHKERAYRLACPQGHAVGSHERPAVLGGSVGVEEREDVGEVDPLRHAEQGGGEHEKGQAGGKGNKTKSDGIEHERRFREALLREAARKAAELGRGQR